MKIAIFSDTFPPQTNGVANVAYQSAKNLARLGHEIFVFTVSKKTNQELAAIDKSITVISLPSMPAMAYQDERLTLPAGLSFNQLKKIRPDIIHTHTPFSVGWEAVLGAKLLKIPLIGTHHTFYDHYLKHVKLDNKLGKAFSWKYTLAYYNRCDLVLSPSESLAQALISKGLKKPIKVLRNSIDTKLFRPVESAETKNRLKNKFGFNGPSITYMGRLSYEKSVDQVVRAFALMLKKMPGLKLMLIGGGPEKHLLEKLAEELKIKKNVIFTGFIYGQELVEALQANEIFLTASKSENMPLSVLEVMAAGLPIISVKEKGLAEIIKENVNGFFAKTDDPADIAQKTLDLLAKPDRLTDFSQASRTLAMEYSEEKISLLLEAIYKNCLNNYS